jgi:hypothetical protein
VSVNKNPILRQSNFGRQNYHHQHNLHIPRQNNVIQIQILASSLSFCSSSAIL